MEKSSDAFQNFVSTFLEFATEMNAQEATFSFELGTPAQATVTITVSRPKLKVI